MLKPGPNLVLRPYEPEDWTSLRDWYLSGKYPEFFREVVGVMTNDQIRQYGSATDRMSFVIESDRVAVGLIFIYNWRLSASIADVAILIDEKFQGRGYFLESLWIVASYLFEDLRLRKLVCEVLKENVRLRSMILKCGFRKEALLKREAFVNGKYHDVIRYFIERPKALKEIEKAAEVICRNHGLLLSLAG